MFGKLIKAIIGCTIGGMVGVLIGKYGAQIGITGSYGGLAVSDVVALGALTGVAYLTRNKESIGSIMLVAAAFQGGAIIVKMIASAIP